MVTVSFVSSLMSPAERKSGVLGLFRPRMRSHSGENADNCRRSSVGSIAPHGRVTEEKHHHVPLKTRLTVSKALGNHSTPGSPAASVGAASAASKEEEQTLFYCCSNKEVEEDRMAEFKSIFVGGHPLWYFRYVQSLSSLLPEMLS